MQQLDTFVTLVRRHRHLCLAAVLGSGALGCAAPEAEDTSEAQQESVGDLACTTVSPLASPNGASGAIAANPHCSTTFQSFTSPNTSYDWSPNACGHSYVAEITGTTNRAFSFTISDAGAALTAASCPDVAVVGAAHGKRVSDGQWVLIGKTTWHGVWVSGLFTFCNFVKDTGSSDIPAATGAGTTNYSRVRVEGLSVGFGIFKRPVSVGISYGPGPC
jgi:hypothetical protein